MEIKPFHENRLQRFLRTVVWKHYSLSVLLLIMAGMVALSRYPSLSDSLFGGHSWLAAPVVAIPFVVAFVCWLYAPSCNRRYLGHQALERSADFRAELEHLSSPVFEPGHKVLKSTVTSRRDH